MGKGPSQANLGHLLEPLGNKYSTGGASPGKYKPVRLCPWLPQHGRAFLQTDANANESKVKDLARQRGRGFQHYLSLDCARPEIRSTHGFFKLHELINTFLTLFCLSQFEYGFLLLPSYISVFNLVTCRVSKSPKITSLSLPGVAYTPPPVNKHFLLHIWNKREWEPWLLSTTGTNGTLPSWSLILPCSLLSKATQSFTFIGNLYLFTCFLLQKKNLLTFLSPHARYRT